VYSSCARHLATVARVFTDAEDELGYYRAFRLVCDTAEQDIGQKLPWGHFVSEKSNQRIKSILVDEHGGQIKGVGRYFAEMYPPDDAGTHVLKIVKTCRVHFERSIQKLESKGVPKGTSFDEPSDFRTL
jgi:hypothetical protein